MSDAERENHESVYPKRAETIISEFESRLASGDDLTKNEWQTWKNLATYLDIDGGYVLRLLRMVRDSLK